MVETWKDIKGYEGIYEVSDMGRVRSSKNKTTQSKLHGNRVWKQRVLKQKVSKDNTCRVDLWKDKKSKTFLVHRLVANEFIDLVEGKDFINHIDGSRLNNLVSNLEWCNHTENNNHAFDNGLINTGKEIVLENLITKELLKFRSMTKASYYLGRNHNYIKSLIDRGENICDNYKIYK